MKKDHIPSGSDVSAGKFRCNNCGYELSISSVTSIPPCPKCDHGNWKTLSGGGDAPEDPYPDN